MIKFQMCVYPEEKRAAEAHRKQSKAGTSQKRSPNERISPGVQ